MTATTSAPPNAQRAQNLALTAVFAAVLAVCATISVTVPVVGAPITLQVFAVLLAGAVLGPLLGASAVALYLVVGLAGAPVFALGSGGLGVLAGPTAGFLISFPLAAAVCGWITRRLGRFAINPLAITGAALAGLAVIYAIGMPVLAARTGMDLGKTLTALVTFLPGDLCKVALAAVVAAGVLKAYPNLRAR